MFIWLMSILPVDMVPICGMAVSPLSTLLANDTSHRSRRSYVSSVPISSICVGSNLF